MQTPPFTSALHEEKITCLWSLWFPFPLFVTFIFILHSFIHVLHFFLLLHIYNTCFQISTLSLNFFLFSSLIIFAVLVYFLLVLLLSQVIHIVNFFCFYFLLSCSSFFFINSLCYSAFLSLFLSNPHTVTLLSPPLVILILTSFLKCFPSYNFPYLSSKPSHCHSTFTVRNTLQSRRNIGR